MAKTYKGKVVFVDGVHYPVLGEGADMGRPLRVSDDGGYRYAEEGEPLHNDTHQTGDLALEVGGEG